MSDRHQPKRGDDVEAFIKHWRNIYSQQDLAYPWYTLDAMLDDYRLCSDTGTTLHQHMKGLT